MLVFISLLIIALDLLIISFSIYFIWYVLWRTFSKKSQLSPPYIPVDARARSEIIKALELKEGDILYDLGCGSAEVLIEGVLSEPKIKAYGVEKNFFVALLARLHIKQLGLSDKIKIIRGDLYHHPVGNATKVFLFLFPEAMDKLLPHLEAKLKPGTLVVSSAFPFSKKESIKIIDLSDRNLRITKKLYVYKF